MDGCVQSLIKVDKQVSFSKTTNLLYGRKIVIVTIAWECFGTWEESFFSESKILMKTKNIHEWLYNSYLQTIYLVLRNLWNFNKKLFIRNYKHDWNLTVFDHCIVTDEVYVICWSKIYCQYHLAKLNIYIYSIGKGLQFFFETFKSKIGWFFFL